MRRQLIGESGRVKLYRLDDESTPYIAELGTGTATPACALGEGEIEGVELTNEEYSFLAQREQEIT